MVQLGRKYYVLFLHMILLVRIS